MSHAAREPASRMTKPIAVAATSQHIAEEAVRLIKVEYEQLPVVNWVLDAMADNAPLLHEDLRTDSMGKKGDKPSNVAVHLHFEKRDPAKGFAEADEIVESDYLFPSQEHAPLCKPHSS